MNNYLKLQTAIKYRIFAELPWSKFQTLKKLWIRPMKKEAKAVTCGFWFYFNVAFKLFWILVILGMLVGE